MKIPKATARLTAVVETSGRPEPVTLWVNPRNDKRFQAAIQQNRVLTVKQETVGTKKDFGIVGFHREPNVAYWIFPKSIQGFEGKRIIGIDYGLLQPPKVKQGADGAAFATARSRPESGHEPSPGPPPKPIPRFRVVVRAVSTVELPLETEAGSQTEAKEKALAAARERNVDFAAGTRSWTVATVERVSE